MASTDPLARALRSLDGLSVGDAFGAGVPAEWRARREPLTAFTHLGEPPAAR